MHRETYQLEKEVSPFLSAIRLKSIARLKQIYSEIACTVEVSDKRCKDSWISAIADYQASKIQKIAPDNQALAQAELDDYIAHQAQAIAPEPITIVEISFDHHEYYAGDELVASISHDDNHLTQRWVVMVNDKEVFRANTLMRCDRFICTHYKDGTLPMQEEAGGLLAGSKGEEIFPQQSAPCSLSSSTTDNEVMAQIFDECEKYGFEILDDGISMLRGRPPVFGNGNSFSINSHCSQLRLLRYALVICSQGADAYNLSLSLVSFLTIALHF
ncbi:hypothetical protein LC613_34520 [Nostoc sphaeroides CHAB 2801]|uniref:hypothetical protein n=1 Tax=Nostoc sphaeroides TaxID=446679 RepID=UPI001E345EFE|nr:hypothetical protein [Nostoc sphaeroides]MCC5632708.1 hypothetical protein [Nostoc sphaeroides CHAB 2801]